MLHKWDDKMVISSSTKLLDTEFESRNVNIEEDLDETDRNISNTSTTSTAEIDFDESCSDLDVL